MNSESCCAESAGSHAPHSLLDSQKEYNPAKSSTLLLGKTLNPEPAQAFILICEDHNNAFCEQSQADALNTWMQKCVALLANPDHEFRAGAIHCVKHFILRLPNALLVNLPAFLNGLLGLHKVSQFQLRTSNRKPYTAKRMLYRLMFVTRCTKSLV